MGGLGVSLGDDEADDDFGDGEEEDADAAHEDEAEEPGGLEGFTSHEGVLGAEVLADEGGAGGADGEAGEEAERFDTDGDEMGSEGSFEGESGDEADGVGVDEPHAEHFDALWDADAGDAGDDGEVNF